MDEDFANIIRTALDEAKGIQRAGPQGIRDGVYRTRRRQGASIEMLRVDSPLQLQPERRHVHYAGYRRRLDAPLSRRRWESPVVVDAIGALAG